MKEFLRNHPEVRSGLRVAIYTFLSGFGLALMGFLTDVASWASSTDAVFPAVEPLGKAMAAALVAAVSGLVAFFYNKLPATSTAQYPDTKKPVGGDRGEVRIKDMLIAFVAVFVGVVAMFVSPVLVSAACAGQPITGGSGNAEIHAAYVSCAAPDGTYTVAWVATITDLSRHNTPTVWSIDGFVQPVTAPIGVVRSYTRQAVLFSSPPRIAVEAYIGMSRPKLTAGASVPGYCT